MFSKHEIFMSRHIQGLRTELDLTASPCPRLTGCISLLFKFYVLSFAIYLLTLVLLVPGTQDTNYWVSYSLMPLGRQSSANLTTDYNLNPEDMIITVDSSKLSSAAGQGAELNDYFRIELQHFEADKEPTKYTMEECGTAVASSANQVTKAYCFSPFIQRQGTS